MEKKKISNTKRDLDILRKDKFIDISPEEVTMTVDLVQLAQKYGGEKVEYFSDLLNKVLLFLKKSKGYDISQEVSGLKVVTICKKKENLIEDDIKK